MAKSPACWDRPNGWKQHAAELKQHAVVYINSDSNSRGYLYASGSHTLETFVNDVAQGCQDPEKSMSVWKRAQLRRIATRNSAERARTSARPSRIGASAH